MMRKGIHKTINKRKPMRKLSFGYWLIISIMVMQLLMPITSSMAGDTTSPLWVDAHPKMGTMGQTTGQILVKANEAGTAYCVVLPLGSPVPLAADVKAGTGRSGVTAVSFGNVAVTANMDATINIAGLTDVTMYDAYVVAEDTSGNIQQTPEVVRISTSILAYYDFESNLNDGSGNENHGTARGSLGYTNGFSGQALSLNGSSYVAMPNDLIRNTTHFTVSMRFKSNSSGVLLGYQNGSPTGSYTAANQYIPMIYIGNTTGRLYCELWVLNSSYVHGGYSLPVATTYRVDDNKWHKVVLTATPTSIDVYVDDVHVSNNVTTDVVGSLSMSYNQIGMGRNDNGRPGSSFNGWSYYTGLIDDVYILSKGIDSESVAELTSDAPNANAISVNNSTGSADTVTVTGLSPGDVVKVYNASTDGTQVGTSTVASGDTQAVIPISDLGADSGSVFVSVTKSGGSESPRSQVPYLSEAAQAANDSIAQAKAKLPNSFTATPGTDTNLLTYLNSISGMSDTGVTLSLTSYNANVADNGDITYTGSSVSQNVLILINKPDGTQDSKMISVTIPAVMAATPTFSSQPVSVTANIGETAYFSVSANTSDGGALSYQWQKSTNSGSTWSDISGEVSPSYTTGILGSGDNASQYRCIVTNSKYAATESATSNTVTLTVNAAAVAPTIDSHPMNTTVSAGGTATFTVSASTADSGVLSYQWQKSDDGGTIWNDITGATLPSYTTPILTLVNNDNRYKCVVLNTKIATTSQTTTTAAILTVQPLVVTFNSQGGSHVGNTVADYNEKIIEPTAPTLNGYTFNGWYKETACTTVWDFGVDPVTANRTLYAKWTESIPTAPAVTVKNFDGLSYPGNVWTNTPMVTVTLSGSVAGTSIEKYQYKKGSRAWTNMEGAGKDTLEVTASEQAKFYFRAVSQSGLLGQESSFTVKLDKIKPFINNLQIKTKNDSTFEKIMNVVTFGLFYKETVVVDTGFEDALSGVKTLMYKFTPDGSDESSIPYSAYTLSNAEKASGNITLEKSPDFKGMFYVYAVDEAGNTSSVIKGSFITESIAPNMTLDATKTDFGSANWYTNIDLIFTAQDAGAGLNKIEIYEGDILKQTVFSGFLPDANGLNTNKYTGTYKVLTQGEYPVKIKAYDRSGNVTEKSVDVKISRSTVTYNANGAISGTVPVDDTTYSKFNTVTVKNRGNLRKPGHSFSGWNTNLNGTGTSYTAGESFNITADTTLYAIWKINRYMVTFVDWNGSVLKTQKVDFASSATAPTQPERTGYTFTGWDQSYDTIVSDLMVSARYTIKSNMVTFNSQGGSEIASITVDYGAVIAPPKNPDRSGYTFGGWFKDMACMNIWDFLTDEVTENSTLFAKWTAEVKEINNSIDRLPNPDSATDDEIARSSKIIVDTKAAFDDLNPDQKAAVGQPREEKLNKLIDRLNAIFIIKPKDNETGITMEGIGTAVIVPELKDESVNKVVVELIINKLDGTQSSLAIAADTLSKDSMEMLMAFDASLLKTVYNTDGTSSSSKISNSDITGFITVQVPLPKEYEGRKNLAIVYIDDNGQITEYDTQLITIDGVTYLEFKTDHFSSYAIIERITSWGWLWIALVVLLIMIFLIFLLFRKKRKSSSLLK